MTEEKPKAKRVCQTKDQLMTECVKWLNSNVCGLTYAKLLPINAINNINRITKKQKALGISAGLPDVFLPIPNKHYHGFCFWFKGGKGKINSADNVTMTIMKYYGYECSAIKNIDQFKRVVSSYLKFEP